MFAVILDGQFNPDPDRHANQIDVRIRNWNGVHKSLKITRNHRKDTGFPVRYGMGP